MANGIKTGDLRGFNKGRSSKFHEGSRVRQTPEDGQRTYRPKCYGNNNKDEDNIIFTFEAPTFFSFLVRDNPFKLYIIDGLGFQE